MAYMKCKMCGGDLDVKEGELVAECEYCGTRQTVPRLDNDRKANLYERANHFRRINEYDKASRLFEQILTEDTTDAEAYWSLILCKYGIEYVEDPATHRRLPTVNRVQYTPVSADGDYKLALQYADNEQRTIYEEEAQEIDRIMKESLDISSKEAPFDIFICYKESDDKGRRTLDSVLANDMYYQLVQEGYKVFFSRITLEDKLGTAYEPYIFAALNSAQIMIVVGTKAEYFNAVWVKNEWNRYLSLIRGGAKKTLIPAYRDMDPYDLPEEFAHLQAQDMSKLGFMQDLIRGIKKIAPLGNGGNTVGTETSSTEEKRKINRSVKQMFLYLEERNWNKATQICEEVLKEDPENAQAYLGKLMLELRVPVREELGYYPDVFEDNINFKRAVRFADGQLKEELERYDSDVKKRIAVAENEKAYKGACLHMNSAIYEEDFLKAADEFATISDYKDANELREKCVASGEEVRKRQIYESAKDYQRQNSLDSLKHASELYTSISGYKDADELAVLSQNEVNKLLYQEEQVRLSEEREREKTKRKQDFRDFITKNAVLWLSIPMFVATIFYEVYGDSESAGVFNFIGSVLLIAGVVRYYPSFFRKKSKIICITFSIAAFVLGCIVCTMDEYGSMIVVCSIISLIIAIVKKYSIATGYMMKKKDGVSLIHPPRSAADFKGVHYKVVENELSFCGFTNIKTIGDQDLVFFGIKKKEGKVSSISINNNDNFTRNKMFHVDDLVEIHYHSRD